MEPVTQTAEQKAIEDKAIAHKRGAWTQAKKAALDADLRKAVRSGLGEHFRIAYGWTERGMQSRCNKIGIDWVEFNKRGSGPAKRGRLSAGKYSARSRRELREAVHNGKGEEYRVKNGLTHHGMSSLCNGSGIDWRSYDPEHPVRVARKARAAEIDAEFNKMLSDMKGRANCNNCRLALMGKDATKAVSCKDRHRPVNGSCPEYSRRLELFK